MNQLRPHGRELLEAARRENTPSPAQRERALAALWAQAERAASASAAPAPEAPRLGGPAKWLLIAAVVALLIACVYLAGHAAGGR